MRAFINATRAIPIAAVLLIGGCSSNDVPVNNPTPPDPNVAISVAPKIGSMQAGSTLPFAATVSGTSNSKVEWAVFSSAPAFGYISQEGIYTAPASIASDSVVVYVQATSTANSEKSDTAMIVVHR